MKGSLCVGRAEREEEMAQGDVVVVVTGQAGQDLAALVGDLSVSDEQGGSIGGFKYGSDLRLICCLV